MIATGHTSVGVILGITLSSTLPHLSFPTLLIIAGLTGLASHYLMDLLPHGHYNFAANQPTRREKLLLACDVFLPVIGFLSLFAALNGITETWWVILFAITGANAPDILDTLVDTGKLPSFITQNKLLITEKQFHSSTHWHNPSDKTKATNQGGLPLAIPRDLWQLATFILALLMVTSY